MQSAFVATNHELERRAIALAFERAIRELAEDEDERRAREAEERELEELLDAHLRRSTSTSSPLSSAGRR